LRKLIRSVAAEWFWSGVANDERQVLRVNYVGGSRQLRRRVAPSSLLPWQEAGGGKLACG
jgi:hypothetical protein